MKMLVVFSIRDRLRFLSHLDLMRAMQRALRRSGLPIRYSQGYNPHILLSFAAPLSVAAEGLREIMEVPLGADCAPEVFIAQMNEALPPLIRCLSARPVDDRYPAPASRLRWVRYRIRPQEHMEALSEALPRFLAQDTIMTKRKTKRGMVDTDIRQMLHSLSAQEGALYATIRQDQTGTVKPLLLMSVLADFAGVPEPSCLVTRLQLFGEGMIPLEDL